MPASTRTALRRKPTAVVMLSVPTDDLTDFDYDFEWFDTRDAVKAFAKDCRGFAKEDIDNGVSLIHLIAEVMDTKSDPMTLGEVTAQSPKGAANVKFAKEWKEKVVADPTLLLVPEEAKAPRVVAPKAEVAKPRLRPKKASPAAEALKAQGPAAPTPKKGTVAQRVAAKKAEIAQADPEVKVNEDDAKAAEPEAPKPRRVRKPAAKAAEPEPVSTFSLGWAIPVGRGANGRFTKVR